MITTNIQEFCLKLPGAGVIFAIDFGTKKLGIAITDPSRKMAMPIAVIPASIPDLQKILEKYKPAGIVIGLPINMDGTKGAQGELVEKFAEKLQRLFGLPILLQDERLTTKAAGNALRILGLNRKQRDSRDDQVAACMILETVLDRMMGSS
jgi:putative Holliday junction resolvase